MQANIKIHPIFREIVEDKEFIAGNLDTAFIERWQQRREKLVASESEKDLAIIAAALAYGKKQKTIVTDLSNRKMRENRWAAAARTALHANRL